MSQSKEFIPTTSDTVSSGDHYQRLPETEVTPLTSRLAEATAPAAIEARTGQAWHDCDFEPAPGSNYETLTKSLREYYRDNYNLAYQMATAIETDTSVLTPEAVVERSQFLQAKIDSSPLHSKAVESFYNSALEYGNMPAKITSHASTLLARVELDLLKNPGDPVLERTKLMLLDAAVRSLFTEASVSVTTLSDTEKDLVVEIASKVKDSIQESGLFFPNGKVKDLPRRSVNLDLLERPLFGIERAQTTFWNDTRYAGQLLFHNSSNMPNTRKNGALLPRRMQKVRNGEVAMATAERSGNTLHSPMVHWSELYDETGYKGHGETPGSVAVPLYKIINSAPFARDSQYQMLRIKPDRLQAVKKLVPVIDGTVSIGSGGPDHQGFIGTDRTFYSSHVDVDSDAHIESAPDGHEFALGPSDYAVALDEHEIFVAMQSGLGESFPRLRCLNAPIHPSSAEWEALGEDGRSKYLQERERVIAEGIANLQHESISRLPDQIVVPVRSGIFDFYVHDDAHYDGRPLARFNLLQEAS